MSVLNAGKLSFCLLQYVESDDLEEENRIEKPVKYYEAWRRLCSAQGVIVPGGFGCRGTEGMILACNWARKQKIPFLGIQPLT